MTAAMLLFGLFTLLAACGVVFSRKTLHCALWLVVTLFLFAVHYALIGADFLAALQVLVYAGAIMVLVIFVIMLLGLNEQGEARDVNISGFVAVCVAGVFVGLLTWMVRHPGVFVRPDSAITVSGTPQAVGYALFTKFLYPFEVTSLLLLAAIIGAVILAYEPKRPLPPGRGLKAKRSEV